MSTSRRRLYNRRKPASVGGCFLGIAQHLRRDRAELDEGRSDQQASQLEAQLGGEVAQRCLGYRIRCHSWQHRHPGQRRHVDQVTASRLDGHPDHRVSAQPHRRQDVDLNHLFDVGPLGVGKIVGVGRTGVVHRDVQRPDGPRRRSSSSGSSPPWPCRPPPTSPKPRQTPSRRPQHTPSESTPSARRRMAGDPTSVNRMTRCAHGRETLRTRDAPLAPSVLCGDRRADHQDDRFQTPLGNEPTMRGNNFRGPSARVGASQQREIAPTTMSRNWSFPRVRRTTLAP